MRGTSAPFLGVALFLTLIWVASPVIAQQAPALPGPRMIVAGKSLAGITIGMPAGIVVQRFGPPTAVVETDRDTVYVWQRFGINVYVRDDLVTAVSTSNSLIRMGDELGPGFRVDDVLQVFGQAYHRGAVEGFPGLQFEDRGIAFGVDRKAVAVILVFTPGQAAAVSGLQRAAKFASPTAPLVQPSAPLIISGIPFVAGQPAFSVVTNYMSLPGYLRWLVYQSSANWITVTEAVRIVREQQTSTAQPGE